MTAVADCPFGKVVLGGGGQVDIIGSTQKHKGVIEQSYPSDADTWTVIGVLMDNLAASESMFVRAWIVCTP